MHKRAMNHTIVGMMVVVSLSLSSVFSALTLCFCATAFVSTGVLIAVHACSCIVHSLFLHISGLLFAVASRRLRSTFAEDESVKPSFQSFDSRKQKGSVLTGACNLLVAEHNAWLAAFRPNTGTSVASSGPSSKPAQDEPQADAFADIDASRRETSRFLHDAATSALSDLKQQHELEGKLLTSSMMVSSKNTSADRPFSRRQSSKEQASSADQPTQQQPGAFAAACAHLWAPLQRNRDADKLYWSRKFSREELTPQDVRSPRR